MDKPVEVPRPLLTAYELLAEFRRDWARRIGGCPDPTCALCRDKKAFITRVESFLDQEAFNG